MDLRSIKPGMVAAHQFPLFAIDPRDGGMVTPIGYGKRGPIWPVAGGSGEGEGDDSDEGDDAEDEDEDGEGEDDDDTDDDKEGDDDEDADKGKKKKKGNPEAKIKALEEEKDRHFRNAKKHKRRADELEARLKLLEDKDLKPEEKADRLKAEQDAKDKDNEEKTQRLALENAFLRANSGEGAIAWHNPTQALTILLADDEYEVEFNDDGSVDRKSLRVELKRLAKANPHLVKPKPSKGDEDKDADDAGSQRQTASTMNGKRKGKTQAKTREELAKRFPALNRIGQ
jgi:hypothetical protein